LAGIFYFRKQKTQTMSQVIIRCPKCYWEPDKRSRWVCDVCNTRWHTFETGGICPGCGKAFEETACSKRKGGCGKMSPHKDWYKQIVTENKPKPSGSFWFWRNNDQPPVTENDRKWIEESLVYLADIFELWYFKSFKTITPDKQYFDHNFTGTEADAEYIFARLVSLMNIDAWEIRLMFSMSKSANVAGAPSGGINESWSGSLSRYVDNGLGDKEIWIGIELLNDPVKLIAILSHELARYKLLTEYQVADDDGLLIDIAAVAFGFGIFKGNSYFKFSQWTSSSRRGWEMQKSGYLPEQVIAYAMAWLAYYRDEDIGWKAYLNKTMKKYFEQSHRYIDSNKDKVLWG